MVPFKNFAGQSAIRFAVQVKIDRFICVMDGSPIPGVSIPHKEIAFRNPHSLTFFQELFRKIGHTVAAQRTVGAVYPSLNRQSDRTKATLFASRCDSLRRSGNNRSEVVIICVSYSDLIEEAAIRLTLHVEIQYQLIITEQLPSIPIIHDSSIISHSHRYELPFKYSGSGLAGVPHSGQVTP